MVFGDAKKVVEDIVKVGYFRVSDLESRRGW